MRLWVKYFLQLTYNLNVWEVRCKLVALTLSWGFAILSSCSHIQKAPPQGTLGAKAHSPPGLGTISPPYRSVQSPVVRIGPCLGVKIDKFLFLFAAPCLFSGATHKYRLEFSPGHRVHMTVDSGEQRLITVDDLSVFPDFDPVVSREELRILTHPRSLNQNPVASSDINPYFDYQDENLTQSIHFALVRIQEYLADIPQALLLPGSHEANKMVMVSTFGCLDKDPESIEKSTPLVEPAAPHKPDVQNFHKINHDPAKIIGFQKMLVYIEGARAAYPKVASLEPLCWGSYGSPIMTMTPQGFRLLGLGLARSRGILIGARADRHIYPKLSQFIKTSYLKTSRLGLMHIARHHQLSCTQVMTLLPDSGPREYMFTNLQFALTLKNEVTAAAESVSLEIAPHDRPSFKLNLDLVDYCTTKETLCYVGVHRDPFSAGVQVIKLEASSQGAALAHWISADGGARPTPLDQGSCQLTQMEP